jgi:hypothetical protein
MCRGFCTGEGLQGKSEHVELQQSSHPPTGMLFHTPRYLLCLT